MLNAPISLAFWFMSFANSSTVPDVCSAMATAASFPEFSISPYISSLSCISSSFFSATFEPPVQAALLLTTTVSVGRFCSSATMAVIIFVVLAIGTFVFASFSYIILPVDASMAIAFLADMFGVAWALPGVINMRNRKIISAFFNVYYLQFLSFRK